MITHSVAQRRLPEGETHGAAPLAAGDSSSLYLTSQRGQLEVAQALLAAGAAVDQAKYVSCPLQFFPRLPC